MAKIVTTVQKQEKNKLTDFLLIIGMVLGMLPLFYALSQTKPSWTSTLLYIALLYPTLAALIHGAPFVPTPMNAVKKTLKAANIKPGEKVYDLGCGDGRVVYLANKIYGAEGVGFELSPLVYALAKIRQFFWRSKAKIHFGNFKKYDLSDADVVFCYLLPDTMVRLAPKFAKELKPGARLVSYAFNIEGWKPTRQVDKNSKDRISTIWIYER